MKTAVNSPVRSKINWTSLVIQIVAIVSIFGWIPAAFEDHLVEIVAILGPVLIQYFRTYKTEPPQ